MHHLVELLSKNMKEKKRQYRSNQGRDPKKNCETYKVIQLAFICLVISLILFLL